MENNNKEFQGLEFLIDNELREDFDRLYEDINQSHLKGTVNVHERMKELSEKYTLLEKGNQQENYIQMSVTFNNYLSDRIDKEMIEKKYK